MWDEAAERRDRELKEALYELMSRFGYVNAILLGNHEGVLDIVSLATCQEATEELKGLRETVEAAIERSGIPDEKTFYERN